MSFYSYCPDSDNFAGISADPAMQERIMDIYSLDSPLAPEWEPMRTHSFDEQPEIEGDFPSLHNFPVVPVFSQHAWDHLRPLIGYCCEPLPIIHPIGRPYSIIHVMETIDCLDVDRSKVKRFTDGGIMRIVRYSFKHEMLRGKHIFKLPTDCAGELIVDEEFRKAVKANKLRGLTFKKLPEVQY